MLQMTLSGPKTITQGDVPPPKAAPGQAVIKIIRTGICGSDIHAYHDKHPFVPLPVVPGHEFSGTIAELGEGVTGLAVGDKVTVMPQLFCMECRNCKAGRYNICTKLKVIGCQVPGSAQELLAVDAKLILKLPVAMTFDQGAMLEPIAVGIHACNRAGGVYGKRVIVQGAGTIGNLTAQAAKAMGAESVLITDLSEPRLALAKRCRIDHAVNVSTTDLATEIEKIWGPDGADVIIECVGIANTIQQAINIARKGTDIVVAGVFEDMSTVDMGLVQDKELSLIGTLMYIKEDWLKAIEYVSEGTIILEPLMSAHFPLAAMAEAFAYIQNNPDTAIKVLIDA